MGERGKRFLSWLKSQGSCLHSYIYNECLFFTCLRKEKNAMSSLASSSSQLEKLMVLAHIYIIKSMLFKCQYKISHTVV